MKQTEVKKEIIEILKKCRNIEITDESDVLFEPRYSFQACDVAYLIISLHQKYHIKVSNIISHITRYSVEGITDAVMTILGNAS